MFSCKIANENVWLKLYKSPKLPILTKDQYTNKKLNGTCEMEHEFHKKLGKLSCVFLIQRKQHE